MRQEQLGSGFATFARERRAVHAVLDEVARASQLAGFVRGLESATGLSFPRWAALHQWSVRQWRDFWGYFQQWCGEPLGLHGDPTPVCVGDDCESAQFFPGLYLNYAAAVLNEVVADPDAPALTECHADASRERWTRRDLRERVLRLAQGLSERGVGPGDRVVAVMRNDGMAVVAALAVTALGATLSTAAPDMGAPAILDRFGPLSPRLLIAHLAPKSFDTGTPLQQKIREVAEGLPELAMLLRLDEGELPGVERLQTLDARELSSAGDPARFEWRSFPFNHPLFIMFSSGTTGRPKCIVHGAGGTLLEHVKEHRLHTDLRPGDRMYFHTSCGWMMWNWQLSALASGVGIVTYDGPIDTVDRLWRLVAHERVTVFGTSPAYLRMSEQAGLAPGRQFDLGALRAILSTGAVLHESQFRWVAERVKDLPLQSISGGTDIVGCFVLGNPQLPVHAGEAQCISLGMDVQAWSDDGPAGGVGELVCRNPFPSRPLGFFGDADGSRFHAAYFAKNAGMWTHGDLIEFSPEGGARLHGRSDGVLNAHGVKFAPIEVQRVVDGCGGVRESMLVEQREPGVDSRLLALLVMKPGATLDSDVVLLLRREIASRLSSAHVPDRFVAVAELPVTYSGKLSEAAARCAVSGLAVGNAGALSNPASLDAIRQAVVAMPVVHESHAAQTTLETRLQALWQELLGVPGISVEDNFFELGGNSLVAAAMMHRVKLLTGRDLPMGALLQAPTIARLAKLIGGCERTPASSVLVRMREGAGRPLYLVHGLSGTVMECWKLVRELKIERPVWGLQARGIDGEHAPQSRVEDMAALYVAHIRELQSQGPYAICGFSFGGLVALEMGRRLQEEGESVDFLCLLDPQLHQDFTWGTRVRLRSARAARKLARLPAREVGGWLAGSLARAVGHDTLRAGQVRGHRTSSDFGPSPAHEGVQAAMEEALVRYRPMPYAGSPVLYVQAQIPLEGFFDPMPVWRRVATSGLEVVEVAGAHLELVGPSAQQVAAVISSYMA